MSSKVILTTLLPLEIVVKEKRWFSPRVTRKASFKHILSSKMYSIIEYEGTFYKVWNIKVLDTGILGKMEEIKKEDLQKEKENIRKVVHEEILERRVQSITLDEYSKFLAKNPYNKCGLFSDKNSKFFLTGPKGTSVLILSPTLPLNRTFGNDRYKPNNNSFRISHFGKPLEDIVDYLEKGIKKMREENEVKEKEKESLLQEAFNTYEKCRNIQ